MLGTPFNGKKKKKPHKKCRLAGLDCALCSRGDVCLESWGSFMLPTHALYSGFFHSHFENSQISTPPRSRGEPVQMISDPGRGGGWVEQQQRMVSLVIQPDRSAGMETCPKPHRHQRWGRFCNQLIYLDQLPVRKDSHPVLRASVRASWWDTHLSDPDRGAWLLEPLQGGTIMLEPHGFQHRASGDSEVVHRSLCPLFPPACSSSYCSALSCCICSLMLDLFPGTGGPWATGTFQGLCRH